MSDISKIKIGNTEYDIKDEVARSQAGGVQSDWNESDDTQLDYIKNKPTIGTAAAKDVPASGNASTTQVVMGNDTRLSDSRPASDVSSWAKASTKPSYTASEVGAIATTAKGAANGVAELDNAGKVPSAQLPSYVDDVIEGYYYNSKFYSDSSHTTEITPETGKIYVDLSTDKTYRWSGTAYTQIKGDLALGETSTTAYRGDRGKTAYNHSQVTSGNPHNVSKSDVGLGNVVNTGDSATPISGGTTKFTTGGAYTELAKKADKVSGATSGNVATLDSNGNLTDSGKTLGKSVPSNAEFTDYNVRQYNTLEDKDLRVLLSYNDNNTDETDGVKKSGYLTYNPIDGNLQTTKLNGTVVGNSPSFTDTKNTAGSTDSSSKLFLIGATSQAANPKTYSQDTAYVGTDGCLYSDGAKVLTAHQNITGKADKVTSATNGNFAGLDSNGNLIDSGHKHSDYLTQHQDISGKADKVSGATSGDVATLDSNGNLVDSGKTLGKSVPSDAVFTDTNNKVTQTNTTGSADYRVLLSDGANDTTETKGARKSTNLKFNPSTGNLQATQLNGVNIGSSPKFTDNDTKNTAGSTDSSSKLFLIGATSQAANPQTYSQDTAYVGTDGNLYSGSKIVGTQNLTGDAWASGNLYVVGVYRIYNNTLYKCNTEHTSTSSNYPGSSYGYWTAVKVGDELASLNSGLIKQITLLKSWSSSSNNSGDITFDYRGYKTLSIVTGLDWGHIYSIDLCALVETAKIAIITNNQSTLTHQLFLPQYNLAYPTSYFNIVVKAVSDSSIKIRINYAQYNGTTHSEPAIGVNSWVYVD